MVGGGGGGGGGGRKHAGMSVGDAWWLGKSSESSFLAETHVQGQNDL